MNEESIFSTASELEPGSERDEFLDSVCQDDPSKRQRVEELLAEHENPDSFLNRGAKPEPAVATTTPGQESLDTASREQIGNYRLLHLLGEGGMGTVYLAEQQQPVRRRVAVKVIKQGMNTRQFIARFEAERQALAMMDHPNIAKVLDAGCTEEDGHPYFVMELVKGIPITDFCDQNRLPTNERLKLFVQVCQAVQHAHQKGIIHRDLKPSNVLVAMYDNQPVPKVIDFGVAKATHQPLTEHTLCTIPGQIVGTWEYMSPEQAILNQLDVDTRTDIYSLGVILYELLTGKTPLDLKSLKPEALEERLRRIREEEPSRPSLRVSSLGQAGAAMAIYRSSEAVELAKSLRGDLDWIVMKALEKDRAKRYETANGFAAEIGRYLNDEPLSFRPPSSWEQLSRFVRRNKGVATTLSMITMSMALVLGVVTWAFFKTDAAFTSLEKQSEVILTEKRRADSALENAHRLLIERGFLQALIGESTAVDETLAVARSNRVSEDWLLTLEGAKALHQGDNPSARDLFQKAQRINKNNTAAKAMLSIALYHGGDVVEWMNHTEDFEHWTIRQNFAELDELFLAYARLYSNFEAAHDELEEILEKHPTWIVAHALYAGAAGESAHKTGDKSFVYKALEIVQIPERLAGDNPFVMMVGIFVRNAALRHLDNVPPEVIEDAIELAQRCEAYPAYDTATLQRADLYSILDRRDGKESQWRIEAVKAWESLLNNGTGNFQNRAIAELYRLGEHDEHIIALDPKDPEAQIAQAFVLAQQQTNPTHKSKAMGVFRQVNESTHSWYLRYRLLQLLMLIEEPETAKEACREWIENGDSTGAINHVELFEQSIKYVAEMEHELNESSDKPGDKFAANYVFALHAYAHGDLTEAHNYLEACLQAPSAGTELKWARAFSERWPKADERLSSSSESIEQGVNP